MSEQWLSFVRRFDRTATPIALFLTIYLIVFAAAFHLAGASGSVSLTHGAGLLAVVIATLATIRWWEKSAPESWPVGLTEPAKRIAGHLLAGGAIAVIIVLAADGTLVMAASMDRHWVGSFPWHQVAIIIIPAALHEELLFRGYLFQRIARTSSAAALVTTSLMFAGLHLSNVAISLPGILNVFLGGLLLGLVLLFSRSIWTAISLHIGWNVVSGPLLGYPVSGFVFDQTLFETRLAGPEVITGGGFGIEGSFAITFFLTIAVAILLLAVLRMRSRERNQQPSVGVPPE